eukprot:COSAG02_NODE_2625_length_8397_cov_2.746806_3_plen_264_part_00
MLGCGSFFTFLARSRYGDLDPRFLETVPTAEDVVTDYSVNPTTRMSRKGNFERNNSAAMVDSARARAAHGCGAVTGLDRNSFPQTGVVRAKCDVDAEDKPSDCCLGLYVGPSLHENLAWRVREAQRKMKLALPGGVGYRWLQQTGSLLDTPTTRDDGRNEVALEIPETAFVCKGFLFEVLNPVERVSSLLQLLPQPCAPAVCSAVSAGHSKGWWCEWPELKQRFESIRSVESKNTPVVRWAVLTKRHWLASAVARTTELGSIW